MTNLYVAVALYENTKIYLSSVEGEIFIVFLSGEKVNIKDIPFDKAEQILEKYNKEQRATKEKNEADVKKKIVDFFGSDALSVFTFENITDDFGVEFTTDDIWFVGTITSETVRKEIDALKDKKNKKDQP